MIVGVWITAGNSVAVIVDVEDVNLVGVDVGVCGFEVGVVKVVADNSMFVVGVIENNALLVGDTFGEGVICNGFGVADGIGDDKISASFARRISISEFGFPWSDNISRIISNCTPGTVAWLRF